MEKTEQRLCENCGKPLKLGVFWKRYCSNSCKQAAYRKRKATEKEKSQ